MEQDLPCLPYETGHYTFEFHCGATLQLDLSFDGISFGIAFEMGRAGCFMLVLHSG